MNSEITTGLNPLVNPETKLCLVHIRAILQFSTIIRDSFAQLTSDCIFTLLDSHGSMTKDPVIYGHRAGTFSRTWKIKIYQKLKNYTGIAVLNQTRSPSKPVFCVQ